MKAQTSNTLKTSGSAQAYRLPFTSIAIVASPVLIACAVIAFVALVLFSPALWGYYIGDDFGFVQLYYHPQWRIWPTLFYSEWSQGIWGFQLLELRPFVALLFMIDSFLWRDNPFGYHLTNLLLHSCNSILVFFFVDSLVKNKRTALVAALLFAMHPVHVEAVYWVTGRNDLLPVLFMLSSFLYFYLYRTRNTLVFYALSLLLYTMGLFAKDIIIPLVGLLIVYDVLIAKQRKPLSMLAAYTPYIVVMAAYLYLRKLVFGSSTPQMKPWSEFWDRQSIYMNWLFPPLKIDYTWIWFALWIIALVALIALRQSQKKPNVSYILLFFLSFVWYSFTIVPTIAASVSPRHLYIPSIGICALIAILGQQLLPKRLFLIGSLAVCVYYGVLTSQYIGEFSQASTINRSFKHELDLLVATTPPGSVLIVDMPPKYRRSWLLSWSSPFVFGEPYNFSGAKDHFQVLERPEMYYTWGMHWRTIEAVRQLATSSADGYMIFLDGTGEVHTRTIKNADLRVALTKFADTWGAAAVADPREIWVAFWEQYRNRVATQ